jgi:hypothetical protein
MIASELAGQTATKPHYYQLLSALHAHLRPSNYIEIGVYKGESLNLALGSDVVVGVDPAPIIQVDVGKARVFEMTSDDFFAKMDLGQIFAGRPIDFAFIDGLHLFEYTLRDFFNVQKHSARSSVVAAHDCYAWDEVTSSRERVTDFWTGDVWRMIPALQQLQPGLEVRTVDVHPTGLCLITNLDPDFNVDQALFDATVEQYMNTRLPSTPEGRAQVCNLVACDWPRIVESLPRRN